MVEMELASKAINISLATITIIEKVVTYIVKLIWD
jgi:hypothetical protein